MQEQVNYNSCLMVDYILQSAPLFSAVSLHPHPDKLTKKVNSSASYSSKDKFEAELSASKVTTKPCLHEVKDILYQLGPKPFRLYGAMSS